MSDHTYQPGRKAVRDGVEGRACIVCGNLPDECAAPIEREPEPEATFETTSGSPATAPEPRKPRRPRRKKGE